MQTLLVIDSPLHTSLHDLIMYIACDASRYDDQTNLRTVYEEGHRDARHAAAELASRLQRDLDGGEPIERKYLDLYTAILNLSPSAGDKFDPELKTAYQEGHQAGRFAAGYLAGTFTALFAETPAISALRTLCSRLGGVSRRLRNPDSTTDDVRRCAKDVESFVNDARVALPGYTETPELIKALTELTELMVLKRAHLASGQVCKTAKAVIEKYSADPAMKQAYFELSHALYDSVRMAEMYRLDDNDAYRNALALVGLYKPWDA
jgi:hypothetical protein